MNKLVIISFYSIKYIYYKNFIDKEEEHRFIKLQTFTNSLNFNNSFSGIYYAKFFILINNIFLKI